MSWRRGWSAADVVFSVQLGPCIPSSRRRGHDTSENTRLEVASRHPLIAMHTSETTTTGKPPQ